MASELQYTPLEEIPKVRLYMLYFAGLYDFS